MIIIIDYGMGNVGSISNMLKKLGCQSVISSDLEMIKLATKIILPGVGSFDNGIKNIINYGLLDVLNQKVMIEKIPILGICLGMQLMLKNSEEGTQNGLDWIDGVSKRFTEKSLRVPHMGWNQIYHSKESRMFSEYESEKRYYFVHSYYVDLKDSNDILTTTNYGHEFTSSFEKGNIIGCQFHPEKSHNYGMSFLRNFLENY
ncbi:imidazole glycerol phosphate synthase subunit HisH [bacterium]|nr:imidazole glycerol phosphate synthase subunit HisH [bacterium]|tara:strand:- start:1374 stop:1979 length:606 start_codon:yes stop_codon:yes gene_type:complete